MPKLVWDNEAHSIEEIEKNALLTRTGEQGFGVQKGLLFNHGVVPRHTTDLILQRPLFLLPKFPSTARVGYILAFQQEKKAGLAE